MLKPLKILSFLLFFCHHSYAQIDFVQIDYLPVYHENQNIINPWAGGINSPQPQLIDLNNDGLKDLVVYEKSENKILTFKNEGIIGAPIYKIAPEFSKYFPTPNSWMICKDYSCDGIEDFFTYGFLGQFDIYTGYYINDTIHFKLRQNGAFFDLGGALVNVYASSVDKPTFIDVNGDSDLDYISFNVGGTNFQYYENLQVENSLNCDSMFFDFYHPCWGYVFETGLNPELVLRDTCSDAPSGRLASTLHVGSVTEIVDINGDNQLDVLLGDISLNILNYLKNFNTSKNASFLSQDTSYPRYDVPLKLSYFPAPYALDINQDERKDLLVSPFDGVGGDNFNNLWYYKNMSNDSMLLELQQKDFLADQMIDIGEWAKPNIVDINSDGLKDLLIATGNKRFNGENTPARLVYYKNIGDANYPIFSLLDDDFLNIKSLNYSNIAVNSSDLDNDGDIDILIGTAEGTLLLFKNNNSLFSNAGFLKDVNNTIIDIGQEATPFIIDFNRDNKKDLIIGERNGNINYYICNDINTLTYTFSTDSLGKITTRTPLIPLGYSSPFVADFNGDSKYDLITGSVLDTIYFYDNIENHVSTKANITSTTLLPNRLGYRLFPTFSDLTGDNKLECLVGCFSGGIMFFSAQPPPKRPLAINSIQQQFYKIFPNPSHGIFYSNITDQNISFECIDITGKLVKKGVCTSGVFDLSNQSRGIYLLKIITPKGIETHKIIID
jgi:hypothetical protein